MVDGGGRQFEWDLPTRIFHWSIVVLLGFSWWCAETDRMEWHYRSGLTLCALLVFRIVWGFAGSSTARFGQFVKGPGAVWRHVRATDSTPDDIPLGHNPVGGWSVLVLLGLLALQIVTGLFAVDIDGLESGPLSYLLDFEQGRIAAEIHELSFNILLGVSAIHVAAILFYLAFKRRNLIGAMITGYRREAGDMVIVHAPIWRLAVSIGVAVAVTYAVSTGLRL